MNQQEFRLIVDQIEEEASIETGIPIKRNADYLELGHDIWREFPVSFKDFVESDLHLSHPALTDRQYSDILKLLGSNPQEVFRDNPGYNVGVLLWGKGCFVGSTKVSLIDGRELSFRDLLKEFNEGKKNRVFSLDTTGVSRVGRISNCKITKKVKKLVEIVYSNGKKDFCTEDHPFMLWDGRYEAASKLSKSKSLSSRCGRMDIISIKPIKLRKAVDVYDITVEGYHNFALSSGVFVHNSGKDLVASCMQAYLVYVLLCMRNPQEYFQFPVSEPLDIVNVSYNAREAKEVFFAKFKERIKNWRWLRERYLIFEGGRPLNKYVKGSTQYVRIGENNIKFPHLIRTNSEHSQASSYEGYNIIFWVMDEASAFMDASKRANANLVYSTLLTSSETRFGTRAKGLILSFPRAKNDFTVRMYEKAIKGDATSSGGKLFGSKGFSWEIKPSSFFCGTTFEYKGHNIPVELKSSFDQFPEEAECRHLCSPGEEVDSFIKFPERVDDAVIDKEPLFITETQIFEHKVKGVIKRFIGKKIISWKDMTLAEKQLPRVIHIDNGVDICDAALAVGHGENLFMDDIHASGKSIDKLENGEISLVDPRSFITEGEFVPIRKTVIDAIEVWVPDKRRQLQVSLLSVDNMLEDICNVLNIVAISYDQWESAKSIEYFLSLGYSIEKHTITYEDFRQVRTCLYVNALELPYYPVSLRDRDVSLVVEEFKHLRSLGGKRIDKGEGYSKDVVDCIAGVVRHVNSKSYKVRSTPSRAIKGSLVLSGKAVDQFGAPEAQPVISTKPKLAQSPSSRRPRPRLSNSLLNRKR